MLNVVYIKLLYLSQHFIIPPRWGSDTAFASHAEYRASIPGRERPKSFKQVVTAPLPHSRQKVRV